MSLSLSLCPLQRASPGKGVHYSTGHAEIFMGRHQAFAQISTADFCGAHSSRLCRQAEGFLAEEKSRCQSLHAQGQVQLPGK